MKATACAVFVAAFVALVPPASHSTGGCAAPGVSEAYAERVGRVLASGRDVWGDRLLAAHGGPTYAAASRLLPPLLYAAGHGGRRLTASGVYYLPFTQPVSVGGARGFGLHVADGSQIVVRRAGGPSLTVRVGAERFGSCVQRLGTPRLADGWLPILQVGYRDARGAAYREESFVGRVGRSLASYLHVAGGGEIRLVTSRGQSLRGADVYAMFLHDGARLRRIDATAYAAARASVVAYWNQSLAGGTSLVVPEARVNAAERALEVQELEMTWRYSVGNVYEELSYAEALDVAQVMAGYGYGTVSRQILRFTLRQLPLRFTNWRAGERLVAGAQYYRLTRDAAYVDEETPRLRAVIDRLATALASSGTGLLPRERYSSDIPDSINSLQGQTLVWQGLRAMADVWAATGRGALAAQCRAIAARLERGLRRAVALSARRLPDGSLFVPAALLDEGAPFRQLTASRAGSYWNLVVPYALASGFFRPHGTQAAGLLRYLLHHGGRLAGLVRAGAFRLSASGSGTDQVYGTNVARFLADNDEADQLVLSLYGTLADALTRGTYVAGEAASVAPVHGERYRTMYLPPNNDGAAVFLEELRLTLVHETPRGLELAFATPRAWLEPGKSIVVRNAPTSFGPLNYSIAREGDTVHVQLAPPASSTLRLRLRLPHGERIASIEPTTPFDARTGTIDLSGRRGPIDLAVSITGAWPHTGPGPG
jgi:hypothetical protein